MVKDHLVAVDVSLKLMVERMRAVQQAWELAEEDDDAISGNAEMRVVNIVGALWGLEYQLTDMDTAQDFHPLGGWPYLVPLLDDGMDFTPSKDEDLLVLVDKI